MSATNAAERTYDSDGSDGNGITDGTSAWNTDASNKVWYNLVDGVYEAWSNEALHTAIFGGGTSGTAGTLTVGTVTTAGIIFNTANSGSYTLNGGTITLAGSSPVMTVNASAANVNSVIAGSNGLIKDGAGELRLIGESANTYTGLTEVRNGTLRLGKTAGVNAVGGDILINGGTLIWEQANMVPDHATVTLQSGGLQIGAKTETIANLNIFGGNSNANTSSNGGTFTITDTLTVRGTSSLGLNSGTNWYAYKVDFVGGPTNPLSITGNSELAMSRFTIGAGGITLQNNTITLNRGTLDNAKGTEIVLEGNVTATGSNAFSINGTAAGAAQVRIAAASNWDIVSGTTTVTARLTGSANLTKSGTGTLQFQGSLANTLTGDFTITGGSVVLAKSAGVDAIAGNIIVAAGGILDWNAANQIADTAHIYLTGGELKFDNQSETFANLTQTAGTVNGNNNSSNGGNVTITGLLRVSGGSSVILNSTAVWYVNAADFTGFSGTAIGMNANSTTVLNEFIIGPGGLTLSGQNINVLKGTTSGALGSQLTLRGDITASGTNTISAGSNTEGRSWVYLEGERTWNIASGTTTSHANVMGEGSLIKAGNGTLALNAPNAYTGNTIVRAGILRLGALSSLAFSPVISVASGATFDVSAIGNFALQPDQILAGGGTVNGSVVVSSGAILSPGHNPLPSQGSVTAQPLQTLTITGTLILESFSETQLSLGLAGQSDRLIVQGDFYQQLGARIVVTMGDVIPAKGLSFDLIDWGSLIAFSDNLGDLLHDGSNDDGWDLDLPSLAGTGWLWDISDFTTSGVIRIVPEPSRAILTLFALAGLAWCRRR